MNTYDFDKTIFYPDSSACFFRYCLRRYPSAVFPTLPRSLWTAMRYRMGKVTAKTLKQQLFSFLSSVPDIDAAVCDFWEQNEKRIRKMVSETKAQRRFDSLRLSPVFTAAHLRQIGRRVDCHGDELPQRPH
jgi:hypothetical protein